MAGLIGFKKTGTITLDMGASVQMSYGVKSSLGSRIGRYSLYFGYTGGSCSFNFNGSQIEAICDNSYNWVKFATTPHDNAINVYIEGNEVVVDYRRNEISAMRSIFI